MSESGASPVVWVAAAGAAFLFLLDLTLSAMLVAVARLGRVALHRLVGELGGALQFIDAMSSPASSYRMAAFLCRQASLLGGCALTAAAAHLAGWHPPWLVGVAVAALVGVLIVEMSLAHALALRYPRSVLLTTARLLVPLHAVVYPLLVPLVALARRVDHEAFDDDDNGQDDSDAEAEALIEVAEREGILEKDESRMIRGIVELGETRVREIMTPRTDIAGLPSKLTVEEAVNAIRDVHHTRLPVFRDSVDDVVGILHVRDLVRLWNEGREGERITAFTRPAFFVPETLTVAELLARMRTRTHIALVVDEYGGVAGLVTLEDLLEEIVGDIRDEHDRDEFVIHEEEGGASWLVNGSAHVRELEDRFPVVLDEVARSYDTVGGLIVAVLGRVPAAGETLVVQGLRVEIVEADPRRVYRVRVRRPTPPEGAAAGTGS